MDVLKCQNQSKSLENVQICGQVLAPANVEEHNIVTCIMLATPRPSTMTQARCCQSGALSEIESEWLRWGTHQAGVNVNVFILVVNSKLLHHPCEEDIHFLFSKSPANAHSDSSSKGKGSEGMDGTKRLVSKPTFRQELLGSGEVSFLPSRQHVHAKYRPVFGNHIIVQDQILV